MLKLAGVVLVVFFSATAEVHAAKSVVRVVPHTPEGLAPCTTQTPMAGSLFAQVGELIRYNVSVDGVEVGRIDFKVERQGAFAGVMATEYRSQFKVDRLLSALVAMEGRAAAVVPQGQSTPSRAMSHYTAAENTFEEKLSYMQQATGVRSVRKKNGKPVIAERTFSGPARDFVSAFYAVRAMPQNFTGCTIVYGNQRAYTMWFTPDGIEEVKTPVGMRAANRYRVRYAHERAKKVAHGVIWISRTKARLPYAVEWHGKHTTRAYVHLFIRG